MLGFTEQQVSAFGMNVGLGGFMAYMFFIVWNLAKESKAGKFGTFVLFLVLGLGMFGFLAKLALELFWSSKLGA